MTIKDIPAFPGESKTWVYQANRNFSEHEVFEINQLLESFARQWTAHNQDLKAWGGVLYSRFIVLMVDETQAPASGCSIDASVHFLKELESRYGVSLFDRLHLAYLKDGQLKTTHRSDIRTMVEQGELSNETQVFNNMVTNKEGLDRNWLVRLKESWAGRLLPSS